MSSGDVHDLGGRRGFGRIAREAREPVFHAPWQGRVLALVYSAVGLGWINIDAFRHGIERMDPRRYLLASYYERWLTSLETVLPEAGVLARGYSPPPSRAEHPFRRDLPQPPRFALGARVRVKERTPHRHCRIPGYTAARCGVVARARGGFVFPDTNAHGEGEQPQHLYTVRFDARELWGESAEPGASVYVDLFEPYLEVVTESSCDVA
jgi:nitrile hydratase